MRLGTWIGAFLLASACAAPRSVPATSTAQQTPTSTTRPSTTLAAPSAPCLEEGPEFTADGIIGVLGQDQGDAVEVRALRWSAHSGCERFVVDLAAGRGAPATRTGPVEAEVLRDLRVVRLGLADSVEGTSVADATFDGDLARRAYVVRGADGGLNVDLHLGSAALVRAFVLSSPGRVVVDLRPGGSPLPPEPAVSDFIVLLTPGPGPERYPIEVHGYARTFEANVVARLRQDGELVVERFTTATDYLQTWGAFSLTLEEGPAGPVELFVGDDSPKDGTEQGVRVDLEART